MGYIKNADFIGGRIHSEKILYTGNIRAKGYVSYFL